MESAQTTSEVMTVTAALGTLEMGSCVMISMNAMRPIHCTTVTFMLTVSTLMEALIALVNLDTLILICKTGMGKDTVQGIEQRRGHQ